MCLDWLAWLGQPEAVASLFQVVCLPLLSCLLAALLRVHKGALLFLARVISGRGPLIHAFVVPCLIDRQHTTFVSHPQDAGPKGLQAGYRGQTPIARKQEAGQQAIHLVASDWDRLTALFQQSSSGSSNASIKCLLCIPMNFNDSWQEDVGCRGANTKSHRY